MAWLYQRGDVAAANTIRNAIIDIIIAAFGGEAPTLYSHLQLLASGDEIQNDHPVFTCALIRCSKIGNTSIKINAQLRPNTPGGNHAMNFCVSINDPTWNLYSEISVQAADAHKSWLFAGWTDGYCSGQNAIQGLLSISPQNLSFAPC